MFMSVYGWGGDYGMRISSTTSLQHNRTDRTCAVASWLMSELYLHLLSRTQEQSVDWCVLGSELGRVFEFLYMITHALAMERREEEGSQTLWNVVHIPEQLPRGFKKAVPDVNDNRFHMLESNTYCIHL